MVKDDIDEEIDPEYMGNFLTTTSSLGGLDEDEIFEIGLPLPPMFTSDEGKTKVGRLSIFKNRILGFGSSNTIVYQGED